MTMEELSEVFSQAIIPLRIAKLLKDKGQEQAFETIRDCYHIDDEDEFPALLDALGDRKSVV